MCCYHLYSLSVLRPVYPTLWNFLHLGRKALDTCWVFLISDLHAGTQLPSFYDPGMETHRITNQNSMSNFAGTAVQGLLANFRIILFHIMYPSLSYRKCADNVTIRIVLGNTEVNTKYVRICVSKNGCVTRINA
jgi:hypothetical protein